MHGFFLLLSVAEMCREKEFLQLKYGVHTRGNMRRRLNPKKTLPWSLSVCIPAFALVAVRDGALPRFLGLGSLVSEMDPFLLSHLRSDCVEPHLPA